MPADPCLTDFAEGPIFAGSPHPVAQPASALSPAVSNTSGAHRFLAPFLRKSRQDHLHATPDRELAAMITAQDLQCLASYLVAHHGPIALDYADRAVDELEAQGETRRADSWKALRSMVGDMINGRLKEDEPIVLH